MFLIALITAAFANDAAIITVPLPDAAAETTPETAPWLDEAPGSGPPLAWTQIGDHRIGDEHPLFDASGEVALACTIQSFELRSTDVGAWASDGIEVWARLDCGSEAVASR